EAERFHRVAFMHKGRTLAIDTPHTLRRAYPGELAVLEVDRVRQAREVVVTHPSVVRATMFGQRLHVTMGSVDDDGPALEAMLGARGFRVDRIARIEPSLEDVFMERIARAEAE